MHESAFGVQVCFLVTWKEIQDTVIGGKACVFGNSAIRRIASICEEYGTQEGGE